MSASPTTTQHQTVKNMKAYCKNTPELCFLLGQAKKKDKTQPIRHSLPIHKSIPLRQLRQFARFVTANPRAWNKAERELNHMGTYHQPLSFVWVQDKGAWVFTTDQATVYFRDLGGEVVALKIEGPNGETKVWLPLSDCWLLV